MRRRSPTLPVNATDTQAEGTGSMVSGLAMVRASRVDIILITAAVLWFIFMMDYYSAADVEMTRFVAAAQQGAGSASGARVASDGTFEKFKLDLASPKRVEKLQLINRQAAVDLNAMLSWGDYERVARMGTDLSKRLADPSHKNNVVIASMTRDDFAGLDVNMWQIEELGRLFDDYRVLIFENDSSPSFRTTLREWAKRNPKVRIVSKDFNLKKRPNLAFLAKLRNMVLDELGAAEYDSYERVVLVDLDVSHRWPVEAIAGSTMLPWHDFGARCFNIITRGGGHRDALALRSPQHFPFYKLDSPSSVSGPTLDKIAAITKGWTDKQRNVLVDSCFGGIAAYSMQAMRECRYDETAEACEHISMNACIRSKQMSVVLDTSAVIKFHYRELKEGRVLLWTQDLVLLLLIACAGAARYLTKEDLIVSRWTLARLRFLVLVGVSAHTWFCFLAKDSDGPRYTWACVAFICDSFSTFCAITLWSRFSSQRPEYKQVPRDQLE